MYVFVRPIRSQQQQHAAGLLLWVQWIGDIMKAYAGSATFTADVGS